MAKSHVQFRDLFEASMSFGPPVLKMTCFPVRQTVEAFERLKQAKHLGKVVIMQPPLVKDDGVYVISGGLGYLGRLVAKALIEGALIEGVLLSSSMSKLPEDCAVEVTVRPAVTGGAVDSEMEEVKHVIGKPGHEHIWGVVHAARIVTRRSRVSPVVRRL
eukprot:127646-Rhodomonas_salina.3